MQELDNANKDFGSWTMDTDSVLDTIAKKYTYEAINRKIYFEIVLEPKEISNQTKNLINNLLIL